MDKFISRLYLQAAQCGLWRTKHRDKFNSESDKMIIEQNIAGIVYPEVQKQLQAEDKKKIDPRKSYANGKKPHKASINHMKKLQSTRK